MKKKPTCKSCAAFKDTTCPGKPETCADYKFRGNRHKGDKKKSEINQICGDPSCKYYDVELKDRCKKNKGCKWIKDDCVFWDMKTSDRLGISQQETDELIAKAKENRMPGNQLRIEGSDQKGKGKKLAHGGIMSGKGALIGSEGGIIAKNNTPIADKIVESIEPKKQETAGIRAIDLLEVFHSAKTSNAFETLCDLCKEKGIEIVIRPVVRQ